MNLMRHIAVCAALALALVAPTLTAADPAAGGSSLNSILKGSRGQADNFLPVDQAFRFDALADGSDRVRLNWEIADGYYLYRSRIKIGSPAGNLQLGAPQMPAGQVKNDENFGRVEVYHHELSITVPVARAAGGVLEVPLEVTYQGCAEAGLCYPPQTRSVTVKLSAGAASAASGGGTPAGGSGEFLSQNWFAQLLRGGNIFAMLGWFYVGGLLLAFTPCVLPMVPILSGIIVGSGSGTSTSKAFVLSLSYVLGMATTYAIAGVVSAAAGKEVQALFQQWWVLALFAALFVALALSMFGLFTVQMPAAIQSRLADLSNRQSAGTLGGVAVMGALSALIVTTCVGPVLVGALIVISQTGAIARGGAALFAAGLGMGTPLLAVGASAGRLLPKAGAWMDLVKKIFGVLMLAVAAWMLARIVPERLTLVLWAVPALVLAYLLVGATVARRPGGRWALRGVGAAAGLYGLALLAGASLGSSDPLAPLPLAGRSAPAHELAFRRIHSLNDLEHEVAAAHAAGRSVLVDFSADWCTSCKEMERYTFTDPSVQQALSGTVLLRADVTDNNADDQALLKHFGIFGPPTIAFYGRDGAERTEYRVVGYMKADAFAAQTRAAIQPSST
ncbi:MAG: protein-disulfide reductase DsbD [Proteobacteria bacterium]|nr:protein-disulfide reductase DsbD [Pseudomonadota bacterium]